VMARFCLFDLKDTKFVQVVCWKAFPTYDSNNGFYTFGLFNSLKFLRQSGLLQNCIGSVPGFDMIVDDKANIGYRTIPDLMITSPLSFKMATCFS